MNVPKLTRLLPCSRSLLSAD